MKDADLSNTWSQASGRSFLDIEKTIKLSVARMLRSECLCVQAAFVAPALLWLVALAHFFFF